MMEGSPSYMKKPGVPKDSDLIDLLFSWSLEDIKNDHLYQVEKIPESFQSVQHYLNSFVSPLLEETRAELWSSIKDISSKPFATVISVNESKPYGRRYYDVKVDYLRNRYGDDDDEEEAYRALPGDIIVLKEPLSDLQGWGRTWMLGNITEISGNIAGGNHFKVKTSNDLGVGVEAKHGMHKSLHIVFLMNITSTKRTWKALHISRNLEVINKALCTHSAPVVEETCNQCSVETNEDWAEKLGLSSMLNESQYKAVVACISKMVCKHKCFVELIWGPPGTGKTTTLSILLWTLLHLKCRTVTCAPTNVAITQVASRVLRLLLKQSSCCCLGDILLFGNKDRLKVGNSEFEEIYLDYRVEKLAECFGPVNGWKRCFTSMIEFLEDPVLQYQNFCENDLINEKATSSKDIDVKVEVEERKSFLGFVTDRFKSIASPLRRCVSTFCTHVSKSFIKEHNFLKMMSIADSLDSFERLLYQKNLVSEELKVLFSEPKMAYSASQTCSHTPTMLYMRSECLFALRTLRSSLDDLKLPNVMNKDAIENFCFQMASSIFCTASSSYKLHSKSKAMEPLQLLVIDEAAQLKECESIIPLQLPGIRHAILIGDQCQLPAMVTSNVSKEAGFGRSLFGRLNHSKHLLNTQYRMHPSISFFPNSKFYQNQIMDASCVKSESYKKCYLPGPVFGPYSFINISGGKEVPVGHSLKNMVEVAVVKKIVEMLYKVCNASEEKLSIGVVSPYAAQVAAIQQKLGHKYEDHGSFSVKVKSIDGFQGGEEDIIILSTVRSTSGESIEFISSPHRTNVALTRARYCLWILGNESTLTNSESIWKEIICDAKVRHCFFDAGEVQNLANFILKVKTELNQLDELFNADSMLFKSARWKIRFNDNFRKSFVKLKSSETKNSVLYILLKLSSGRRPKGICVDIICERSSHILKQFKVGRLYVVCSIDIVKESCYIQVLTVWDIMPLEDIRKLVKRLDNIFETYTDDYLNRCKVKCMEGMLEVPMSWATSSDIVQYKDISKTKTGKDASAGAFDEKDYGENSKLSDCLLLLKFYALSSDVVSHLLSSGDGRELGPSFELTDQQKEIIHYNRSTFILGRSGTGKTAILTRKLFQNEQLYRIASEGLDEGKSKASESDGETKGSILRQIFVTVSPKLCHAIKQDVSQLKSFVCGGNSSAESSSIHMDDIDDTAQFADIPDSFVDLLPRSYPLVITFHKFLMMLDGTVGTSYFERFPDLRKICHGKTSNSTSVALETFIRTKEVNYDRFSSTYWPHFNVQLTKKLECSSVFTEIMSVIKGGIQAGEASDERLSREEYVSLSDGRGSTLSGKREIIYDIFLQYERKKAVNGDFDLSDLVIDLHFRLKDKGYEGDHLDFVYIDEVQDLSMSQISLFKYMCRNVDEGFVFAGDTAQTIARGIDFSFEDIRCLFYKEFVMGLKRDVTDERREKGKISDIFHLSHNFRTHAGVLNLAQSVVDPLYHFFPSSIDKLSPENSPLCGEAPILLESKDYEDAIITIFENSGNGGNVVSFGAEQVILVRDDFLRESISHYIGKKALVLTILECKGLEFQDVLLYNFFSSSPFRNQWRVIYEYMKENDLLDTSSPRSFPSFDQENHNVLCSELKQLYVAITRTKRRLWICENVDEFSRPMFDYWKKLGVVQVRQLDDLFAKELQVSSSQEEWKSKGIKFFHEHMYKMAMMCFERAGDRDWERLAEAYGFRATADRMRGPDPEISRNYLRKAAEIFDSIDKAELAAQCYFELNEYERAGKIYSRDSKLEKAGECFSLAGCYKPAAKVYARAKLYSNCLSACIDGKLFDLGLEFIQSWEQDIASCADKVIEMRKVAYDFLHRVALYYYELKDNVAMMKFVKSFHTIELIRTFLNDLDCIDELFSLEKERGNFLEAANIAKKKGDLLLEADVVEKAGLFREASMLILWYVFSNSLEQLKQKDELLTKAKSIAKNHSDHFYEFVCEEADILSKERANEEVLDMRLMQFLQYWKQNAPIDVGRVKRSYEIDIIEKNLLKEAVKIAEQKGDLLCMADLLEKAGDFKEASMVLLWYCFASSLWVTRSKGWPLKQFKRKEKILTKAKSCAKSDSDLFYEFVCMEANILSNSKTSLSEMKQNMIASQKHKSLRGEILSAWKILDDHLNSNTTKYEWNNVVVDDLIKHSEDLISQNRVTMETLIYFWDFWKEKIVNLIDSLWCIGKQNVSEYMTYENFCLNYMGVQKHDVNKNTIYLFLYSDANWLREIGCGLPKRNENLFSCDAQQFVPAIKRYWCSEIHFVGLKVLKTLEALYDYSVKNSFSMFHQTMSIVHIFEVATFLRKYNFVDRSGPVQEYIDLSCNYFFGNIFALDWRKSLMQNMIFLRGTEQSMNILSQVIFANISTESPLTYGQMSRVVVIILGSGGLTDELYKKILESFIANSKWREFIGELIRNRGSATNNSCYSSTEVSLGFHYDSRQLVSLVCKFSEALKNARSANWEAEHDFISPSCFLYLVERLILLLSCFHGYFLTTKSSFVEWLIFQKWSINPSSISINDTKLSLKLGDIYNFLACVVQELLLKIHGAMVVLRLVVVLCLICVNSGKHFDKLFNMLGRSDIVSQLPRAFCDALRRAQKCDFIYVLADALGKIENPLVLVNLRNNFSKFSCSDAIFVSMKVSRCREDLLQALFAEKGVTTNSCSNDDHDQEKGSKFWEILDGLELLETGKGGDAMHLVSIIPIIKEDVDTKFQLISSAMASFKENNHQDEGKILLEANSMLDALNQLSSALDISEGEFDVKVSTIGELSKTLRSRRREVEPFLNCMFFKNEINAVDEASEISSAVTEVDENSKADRNNSEEDMMKDDAYPTIKSIKADDENSNSEEDKDER